VRTGTHALSLLSVPLNVHVVTALTDQQLALIDLRRAVGSPPETTMRGHMRELTRLDVLERRRQSEFPGNVDYDLGAAGRDLIGVLEVLQGWLANAPDGPLQPGSVAARSAMKALIEGWSSTIVRALAAKPLSLTELNQLISSLNYPSLERRLGAMRLTGLIEPCPSGGRGTPYTATRWLRGAIAPLAAATRWERKHMPQEAAPVGRLDIEAALLLSVPVLRASPELGGVCRLAVEVRSGSEHRLAGVLAQVKEGRVTACTSRLQGEVDAWVSGSASAWLRAVIEGEPDQLETGGESMLAGGMVDSLHAGLFGAWQRY